MRILGADPGLSGAVAILGVGDNSRRPHFIAVMDLPTCEDGSNRQLDIPVFGDWLERHEPDVAWIENVQPMPSIPGADGMRRSMGAASSFRFGVGVGQLRGCLAAYRIPIKLVVPRVWKKHFGLVGPTKEQSRLLAIKQFPDTSDFLKRKKDHQRAESILIAAYGFDKTELL